MSRASPALRSLGNRLRSHGWTGLFTTEAAAGLVLGFAFSGHIVVAARFFFAFAIFRSFFLKMFGGLTLGVNLCLNFRDAAFFFLTLPGAT